MKVTLRISSEVLRSVVKKLYVHDMDPELMA